MLAPSGTCNVFAHGKRSAVKTLTSQITMTNWIYVRPDDGEEGNENNNSFEDSFDNFRAKLRADDEEDEENKPQHVPDDNKPEKPEDY